MLRIISALALLALASGCAPDSPAPVRVRALILSTSGAYAPQEVLLRTVTDPVELRGQVANIQGGGTVLVDANDPLVQKATNEAALQRAILKQEGEETRVSYLEKDGVLWPTDFHSWNLVTTYYALEQSFDYFRTVGNVPVEELGTTHVYYFPSFTLRATSSAPLRDNALYFSLLGSFLILPFDAIQRAPLSINAGVIAHEYSHWVFNRKVYGGAILPEALSLWSDATSTPGINVLKSIDEGLADFHAWGVTCKSRFGCNPQFLSSSFDAATTASRNLSRTDLCMDANLRQQLVSSSFDTFAGREYSVGSILASALYQASQGPGQGEVLQRAVVAAYSDSDTANPGLAQLIEQNLNDQTKFTLGAAAAVLVRHIDDVELKRSVCSELLDHLQIPRAELRGTGLCPDSVSSGTTCPNIN